ncbi:MAG: glycosyltransferase family 1 protein [Candidatus Auribacterota bacterium]
MPKHIIIDARVCDGRVHGISRVSEQLLKHLLALDDDHRYTILCANDYCDSILPVKSNVSLYMTDAKLYSLREQIDLPRVLNTLKPDLFYSPTFTAPYFAPCPVLVHIHDLIPMIFPAFFPFKYKPYYRFIVKPLARKADRIITCSENSRADIARLCRVDAGKISVVYNAGFTPDEQKRQCSVEGLRPGYVLFVGNEMPHKNFINAVHAYAKARFRITGRFIQMAAVGISKDFYKQSEVKSIPDIYCMKYVPPGELLSLYENASALFFPSLYEGFGIPPVEAMMHGVPVVSSNCSSIPEVLGDAYTAVDPNDVDSMADGLYNTIENNELRKRLEKKGFEQVKKYSWTKSAEKLLTIFREMLS